VWKNQRKTNERRKKNIERNRNRNVEKQKEKENDKRALLCRHLYLWLSRDDVGLRFSAHRQHFLAPKKWKMKKVKK
jgi:hypothetical protein